jgi:hypothetical protein
MHDADPLIAAITGRAVTPERIDSARRHLVMLCSLLEEVRDTVPRLVPPRTGAWRSTAADHYVDGLDELRVRLFGARDRLADAVYALEERIRRMQAQLDAQATAARAER